MKRILLLFSLLAFSLSSFSQKKTNYQGLLWEITGNGLKKPSYLYGTMHVSNKVAFHLNDSFFLAINSVDMAALEIDPRIWLDYIYKNEPSVLSEYWNYYGRNNEGGVSNTKHLGEKRKKAIKNALSRDLEVLNYLMFRNDEYSDNFEEDTYLDLYIFQTARKLNKKFTGLEFFDELDEIDQEIANSDETEDFIPGSSRYNRDDDSPLSFSEKVEDAYRRGDLDLLDSLVKVGRSKAYVKLLLFKRNETMVHRMDSLMKTYSLFTGVGSAHLPGENGMIELLREKGYTVRAVAMGERDAEQKKRIDTMKFAVTFEPNASFDGYFKVETPGTLYEFPGNDVSKQYLCADMVNGAYYRVIRLKTFGHLLNNDEEYIYKTIDSVLYENIPGEILSQKKINKFGMQGFDITNRTRKGSHIQRYQIFVGNAEIFIFKLAGTGDYAKGPEADRFFNSIKIEVPNKVNWFSFYSPDSLFSIRMPHSPLYYNDTTVFSKWLSGHEYSAVDFKTGNQYYLIKTNNYTSKTIENDSIQLERAAFEFSDDNNFDEINRNFFYNNGRPVLDAVFLTPDTSKLKVRFTIKMNNTFTIASKYNKDSSETEKFINSFTILGKDYPEAMEFIDSALLFKVQTGYVPPKKGQYLNNSYTRKIQDHKGYSKTSTFYPPNSYNGVSVEFYRYGKYYNWRDSARYFNITQPAHFGNSNDLGITYKRLESKNGYTELEMKFNDTGSTMMRWYKIVLKNGVRYVLSSYYDSVEGPSQFLKTFYKTFEPLKDTSIGKNLFTSRAKEYIEDLGGDSAHRAQALESLNDMDLFKEDFKYWTTLIDTCDNRKKNYIDYKAKIITKLKEIKTADNVEYLSRLYTRLGDTSTLQMAALNALATIRTEASYKKIKELIFEETPLVSEYNTSDIFYAFDDSLELSKMLYPDLFQLMPYNEYKKEIVNLLGEMVDSGVIKKKVYRNYYPQLLTEAKIALKREARDDVSDQSSTASYSSNYYLENLSATLLPYYKEKKVRAYFDKLLALNNLNIKLSVMSKMLKTDMPVNDSLFIPFGEHLLYRAKLYRRLEELGELERFPAQYKTQELMVQSLFKAQESYADSVVILDKRLVDYEGVHGWVYFVKYKTRYGDNWLTGVCGIQPEDTNQVSTNTLINYSFDDKLSDKISMEKQFTKLLKRTMLRRKNYYSYY